MKKRWWRALHAVMLAPCLLLVVVITAGVTINTLLEGLGWLPELGMREIGWAHFARLFSDPVFLKSLCYCLKIAVVSTAGSVLLGTVLACLLAAHGKRRIARLTQLPVILSYMAAAVLLYNTFSRYGLLYHVVQMLGIRWDGPDIVFSSSGWAVILLYLFKGVPYIALSLLPIYERSIRTLQSPAYNLGAGRITTFLRVIVPTGRRTMLTGALVLFNFDLTAYEGYAYLGTARPAALGVLALQTYQKADLQGRADAMAINAVMIAMAFLSAMLFSRAIRKEAAAP